MMVLLTTLFAVASATPLAEEAPSDIIVDDAAFIRDAPIRWETFDDMDDPAAGQVWNGTVTSDFPYVVALMPGDGSYFYGSFCSGTLISDQWVLTAAHCLTDVGWYENQGLIMFVGVADGYIYSGLHETKRWANYYIHPQYNENTLRHDIGLIELRNPINYDLEPMVLNDEQVRNGWVGDDLVFVGYGIAADNDSDSGDTKRFTTLQMYDYDNYVMLSYNANSNVCSGDSGGAVLEPVSSGQGYEIAGVNSYVTPGCVNGATGSTRVDTHIDWIQGYVPDARVDHTPLADDDPPEEEPDEPVTEEDPPAEAPGDELADADDWEEPAEPAGGDFPVGVNCGCTTGAPSAGWIFLLGAPLLWRRRRA